MDGVSGLVSLDGYAVTLTRFDGKTYEIKGALPAAHRLWARGVAVWFGSKAILVLRNHPERDRGREFSARRR